MRPGGLTVLGSSPARFQAEPPACYRAPWRLPGPDFHRQATTSFRSGHDRWTITSMISGRTGCDTNRGQFPSEQAALKVLYLAVRNLEEFRSPTTGIRSSGWKQALQAFTIYFEGRIPTP
jgi:hypothetical protein